MPAKRGFGRTRRFLLTGAAALALVVSTLTPVSSAEAAPVQGFNAGRIITDALFYDGNSMGASEVQSFLNQRVARCTIGDAGKPAGGTYYSPDGWSIKLATHCLKDGKYSMVSMASNAYCSAIAGKAQASAAEIIAGVGQACGISQRVLLVLLEKEQSLIQDTFPAQHQLDRAMGYGCPDSGPNHSANCDTRYYGLFNQVYYAAWQLKVYQAHPTNYNYRANQTNTIQWHPNPACGTSQVYIENLATAALYIYTPYRPNQAALSAGWGLGDSCSSYGNRNFFLLYTNWFGSTGQSQNPFGAVDSVRVVPGGVEVSGWAIDPNTANPISVHAYLGGSVAKTTASLARDDVGKAYPSAGPNHGYTVTIPATRSGTTQVCVYGINVGGGSNALLKPCQSVSVLAGDPIGRFDEVKIQDDNVVLRGWAFDPDRAGSVRLHIYVNGTHVESGATGLERADVTKVYPTYGANVGYEIELAGLQGKPEVCVFALNEGIGRNSQLGCKIVELDTSAGNGFGPDLGRPPIGRLDSVSVAGPNEIEVRGWAIDPDVEGSVRVHLYVDGKLADKFTADGSRIDVARVYPAYGESHGYSSRVQVSAGDHQVCAYGINTGPGGNALLGCRTVVGVPGDTGAATNGRLDQVIIDPAGYALARGWAAAPGNPGAVRVEVKVDGSLRAEGVTSTERPDVQTVYPEYGLNSGYEIPFDPGVGIREVCATGVNPGSGPSTTFICKSVVVESAERSRVPIGRLDSVVASTGELTVSGWAIDPDNVRPTRVHVYVDGRHVLSVDANQTRNDVSSAYPGYGPLHGYGATISAISGTREVCTYGINLGPGGNSLLGCKSLTVR